MMLFAIFFFWWYRRDAVHPFQFLLCMEAISLTVSNILINYCKYPVTYSVQYERKILLGIVSSVVLFSTLTLFTVLWGWPQRDTSENHRWVPLEWVPTWFSKGCTTKEQIHIVWRRPREKCIVISSLHAQ